MSHARWVAVAMVLLVGMSAGCSRLKRFAYEGWGRDGWQKPEEVVGALAIPQGARVADLGAGGGYFTFRLAGAVGEHGKVYAVDVDPDMLVYLEGRAREEGHANVQTVAAATDDPALPEPVDLIFLCNTYHHIGERETYFARAQRYLRPGGRIAIVEPRGDGWFHWFSSHATSPDAIQSEMWAAGFRLAQEHDFLSRQSFLVFVPGTQ